MSVRGGCTGFPAQPRGPLKVRPRRVTAGRNENFLMRLPVPISGPGRPFEWVLVHAFLVSFGIIFVAELGDKSQLMALAFAARFRAVPILIGIAIATALVHAVSVGIGAAVGVALPTDTISVIAGLAFFAFAAWTLRGDTLDADDVA